MQLYFPKCVVFYKMAARHDLKEKKKKRFVDGGQLNIGGSL